MLMGNFSELYEPSHSKEVPSELEQMYKETQRADDNQHRPEEKNAESQKFKWGQSDKYPTLGVTEKASKIFAG